MRRSTSSLVSVLLSGLCLASLGMPAVSAAGRSSSGHTGTKGLTPAAGPRQLRTVAADAFPVHHGFGDQRFGVVQSTEAPAQANDLHVGWTREEIRWDLLQPKGAQQWDVNATLSDRPIDDEIAHGHQVIGIIEGIPAWAAQNPKAGSASVPKNIYLPWNDSRNYWGQFIYRAARHYAGRIDTLVILNEVNIAAGPYHQFAGTPAQYAQMLRVAYLAAHAANPHVEIHMYGDSVFDDHGAWFSKTVTALAAMPNARANNYFFDATEVHLYSTVLNWNVLMGQWHAIMKAHGFDKPIWMSETGVAPRDDKVSLAHPAEHNAPLAIQPNFLVDSFAAALGLGMPRVEVYRMLDPKTFWPEHPMGLVRRNGTKRPIYTTFKTISRWLAGVTATRYYPGSEPANNKNPLFRVVMERPGQEVQVLWDQAGAPIAATVPALSATATVVNPLGATRTVHAAHGVFTLKLAAATDHSIVNKNLFKIGGVPLLVVQNLPKGKHVPGLAPLFVERNRTAGAGATLGPVNSVATVPDGSGRRVVADTAHDRVLVEDASGHVLVTFGGTGGQPGQFRGPAGVAVGSDGTVYVADQGNARIQEFDLSGNLLGGFGSWTAGAASLHAPVAVAAASDGTIYVVDAARDAVLHFTRQGSFINRWGAMGYGVGKLDGPGGIAIDGGGNVYVADTLNNRVVEFDGQGRTLTQIGTGNPSNVGNSLHWPTSVSVLPNGHIAIADADNGRVVVVSNPQTFVSTTNLSVSTPGGFAIAPDGTYYVSDTNDNKIMHVDANGNVLGGWGISGTSDGHISHPLDLAFGPDGNLYIADSGNGRIQVFKPDGTFVRRIGHYGSGPGEFIGPRGIAVASDGTIWVADTVNSRVQHLSATGQVLGIPVAHINGVYGVAADNHGGVYYTARWGQRVYHWTPSGQQVWGAPGSGPGEFAHPAAIVASADGSTAYAVDEDNQRVQFIVNGTVAGMRGGSNPGPSGLSDPIAVAIASDGTLVVLDAGRHKLVRYVGADSGAFNVITTPGVPLGIASDATGTTAMVDDSWAGSSTPQALGTTL